MSMHDYAVNDYGLVLNSNTLNVIAAKIYDECTEDTWKEDKYEFIEGVVDTLRLESISNFSGEAIRINDDGSNDYGNSDYYNDDEIYYMGFSGYPTLFKSPYVDISDPILECKNRLGRYLPSNYPYRDSIRHIVGTYYG